VESRLCRHDVDRRARRSWRGTLSKSVGATFYDGRPFRRQHCADRVA
jgi:hypothetical protein